ncbi:phage protein NinX family protein [Cronobacter sakazakii]
MDYSKLSDQEINMQIARVLHPEREVIESKSRPPSACVIGHLPSKWLDYCNNPADAWPIIVANGISLNHYTGTWEASYEYDAPIGAFGTDETVTCAIEHKNPLRAAMIAFLLMQESQHA